MFTIVCTNTFFLKNSIEVLHIFPRSIDTEKHIFLKVGFFLVLVNKSIYGRAGKKLYHVAKSRLKKFSPCVALCVNQQVIWRGEQC